MTPEETVDLLKKWLTEERLSAKAQKDPRAHAHFKRNGVLEEDPGHDQHREDTDEVRET